MCFNENSFSRPRDFEEIVDYFEDALSDFGHQSEGFDCAAEPQITTGQKRYAYDYFVYLITACGYEYLVWE